ncbi:MAG: type II CAAX endopeptidase family protein [Acidobacteriota bacterium]
MTENPSPNDPPWNSWVALIVWFSSVLLILILPTLFLLPYLTSSGIQLTDSKSLKEFATSDPTAVILQLVSILPAHLITLALCWLVITRVRKYPFFQTLGFKMGGYRWWHFILIILGILICILAVGSVFPEQDNDVIRMLRSSRTAVYLLTILATFTAPIVEEVVYRGVLYSAFQRSRGTVAAIIIVTFMFAGVHYLQYWGSPGTIILITILSLTLTLVRSTSRNLLPCIILHFLFNGLQSISILQQSFGAPDSIPEKAAAVLRLFH